MQETKECIKQIGKPQKPVNSVLGSILEQILSIKQEEDTVKKEQLEAKNEISEKTIDEIYRKSIEMLEDKAKRISKKQIKKTKIWKR